MLPVGTRITTTSYSALTGTSHIYGVIGEYCAEHNTYRIDWDEGGYDYLCEGEFDVLTTYRVYFTDVKDGCANQKLLESANVQDIYDYMACLGHTDVKVEPINEED